LYAIASGKCSFLLELVSVLRKGEWVGGRGIVKYYPFLIEKFI